MDPAPTIGDVIERVSLFRGREVAVRELSGGHMNSLFLVETEEGRYVVRLPGRGRRLLVPDPENERHNAEAAAAAGASPRVVAYVEEWDVMVRDYVEGEVLTPRSLGMREQVPRVAAALRRLHAGPRFRGDADWFGRVRAWSRLCEERGLEAPAGLAERMGEVARAAHALAAREVPTVPCHNDLSPDNLIDDGRRLWIVDFEYSGMNDACFDVGDVAYESDLDEDWRARLCEAYFGAADRRCWPG